MNRPEGINSESMRVVGNSYDLFERGAIPRVMDGFWVNQLLFQILFLKQMKNVNESMNSSDLAMI